MAALTGVMVLRDAREEARGASRRGPSPSSPATRSGNTTFAMPNPPQMNPNAISTVAIQLSESIEMKTLTLGETRGAMPPELYANENWLRKLVPAMC